jgi:hypothetical protein
VTGNCSDLLLALVVLGLPACFGIGIWAGRKIGIAEGRRYSAEQVERLLAFCRRDQH